MITEVTDRDELDLGSDDLTVVDFYRNDCQFCDMLEPVFEEVAFEIPVARFVKVNCSTIEGLADEHDVRAYPTVKLFRGGQEVDSMVGFQPASVLIERIGKHLY